MSLIVQKYGGTSVGSPEKIKAVAERVLDYSRDGHEMVVVLSAMSGETDRLISLANSVQDRPDSREMDVLLSTGEQVTISLFAMAIKAAGFDAISFLGDQVKISTSSMHTKARIKSVDTDKVKDHLTQGKVVVIAGFQGVDDNGDITTLGRGGSDTTAVALAAALCTSARKIERISYDEMLELASLGAKVLDIRSVGLAKRYKVPLHVRSTFVDTEGTWVIEEDKAMESMLVSGVTYNKNEARITISKVPDNPGIASKIFMPISDAGVVVDMIIQNTRAGDAGVVVDMIIQNTRAGDLTDLTFTVPRTDFDKAMELVKKIAADIGAENVSGADNIAKVSIVGVGMRNHSGIASTMFHVLANEGINIMMISTSEIKVSCVIEEKYTELAIRALHDAFALERDDIQ
jgi:aspartate kinase